MSTAWFISILFSLFQLSPTESDTATYWVTPHSQLELELDEMAAFEAFAHLRDIRENPDAYTAQLGICPTEIPPYLPQLRIDPVLMRVAELKAIDMAQRDYFSHISPEGQGINGLMHQAGYTLPPTWRDRPERNFFESLAAGLPDGQSTVQALIIDDGVPSLYHRKHLLGQTDFFAGCEDVGIAFVRAKGRVFRTYCCIILARKQ